MAENKIFYSKSDNAEMLQAFQKAQDTFKYFWRELYWEYRRIVPALDLACVKIAFTESTEDPNDPIVEHMWVNDINFDGVNISGILLNEPNELSHVQNGDEVKVPLEQLSDWLFASQGKTYGGFTIHAMRSEMNAKEMKEHDKAWGLDFGDFDDVLMVYQQREHPENLVEHPMSKNMRDSFVEFLKENPNEMSDKDDLGYTMLHREAIAGNATSIEVLKEFAADVNAKTNDGKTALDFAKALNWEHLIPILSK
jgi:uncharacterized protein YegJ (DUF2314 family)